MRKHHLIYSSLLIWSLMAACADSSNKDTAEKGVETVLPDAKNEVTVMTLKKQNFHHELVSNGKVNAGKKADLRFESSEVIAAIYVKNGDRVRKGQKLAELDRFKLANKRSQAENALEKARLDLQDVLIGQGYAMDDSTKIPEETMKLAKVKSGYDQTKAQYELARREEERAVLVAPFDGIVANLFSKPYNLANASEVFCSIVDMKEMEVDFSVLESELPLLKNGDRVTVIPYADSGSRYEGKIAEINPIVDEKGMVKVGARVNGAGKLFSGMNVRVIVQRSLGNKLVIPKSALVLRSGKQVVFTLKDGAAQWNYVQTGLENMDSYVVSDKTESGITDGLQEGDVVIVSGNVNLAHEAPVTVSGN